MALELLRSSKYYSTPELRMICVQEICLRISKCNKAEKKKKTYQIKKFLQSRPQERRAACRGCCFSLPLLMNVEVICLSEEESRGEAWFPLHFYLCPTAPASQPPVLSHAGVPQEAALHKGQRSGKDRKPLVLSFTTKLSNTQRCVCHCAAFFDCRTKHFEHDDEVTSWNSLCEFMSI